MVERAGPAGTQPMHKQFMRNQKAMKQAKAKASEAAAQLNDPEMQKKMKQAAQNAVDQAQLAAQLQSTGDQ